MEDLMNERVAQLENYIMKKCLWQFHSRTWDREKQNEGVLTKTTQILCDEPVDKGTPADRCYWADAVVLAEEYTKRFDWLAEMGKEEIKLLMQALKERIDYVTITGSLNKELTVKQY
ncbi:Fe-only nitrogenase subunit delta [Paenibacillus sp. S150]|uniref:Fe-only nitrogenase subunit delta n=1 Tax=Paenibacillus sp. S150 TaxID=2749826 RepID=UPI001C58FFE5|nr:Fe-only nitrogenase subunit delta [Paenibacillus sp. S150]MBW4082665.1 Fe-only nitrogenase subunit delta [Paenibacillus sp. S150]